MIPEEKESVRKEIDLRIAKTKKTIERLREQIKPIEVNDGSIGRVTRDGRDSAKEYVGGQSQVGRGVTD